MTKTDKIAEKMAEQLRKRVEAEVKYKFVLHLLHEAQPFVTGHTREMIDDVLANGVQLPLDLQIYDSLDDWIEKTLKDKKGAYAMNNVARIGAILAMAGAGIYLFFILHRMACTYGL